MEIEIENIEDLKDFLSRQYETFKDMLSILDKNCLIPATNPEKLQIQFDEIKTLTHRECNIISILFIDKDFLPNEMFVRRVEIFNLDKQTKQLIPRTLEISDDVYGRLYEG